VTVNDFFDAYSAGSFGPEFLATVNGECDECCHRIQEGVDVCRMVNGRVWHSSCATGADE